MTSPPPDAARAAAPPRLAVVVLTWNGREDTLACLGTLRSEAGPGDAVIVVDNGSSDGTEDAVRREHPWAVVIQTGANLGFAGGNDAGIRHALAAGFPWILLLNNDTLVPPGALGALLAHAQSDPGTDVFQPLLVRASSPDTIDSAGQVVFRCPGAADALMGSPVSEAPSHPVEVFGACAAAALVRADALRAAGLLDEAFFVIAEDVDLMFRIRLLGKRAVLVPGVRVLHRRGVSGGARSSKGARRREFWLHRNTLALGLRYWPAHWLALSAPLLAWRALRAIVLAACLRDERCVPLWAASLRTRRGNRTAMRRRGLDRWFAVRHRDWRPPAA